MRSRLLVRVSAASLFAAAVAVLVACGPASDDGRDRVGFDREAWTATKVCPKDKVEGVDISAGQGTVDWKAFKASGHEFAFMKATQGTGYVSSAFAGQWSGSKAAGVLRSPYHFFDPTVDGHAQASHFLSIVGKLQADDLPAMLDMECPDGDPKCLGYAGGSGTAPGADITARALDWLHDVEAATGKKPIIYSFPAYFDGAGVDVSKFKDYPLFIATLSSCASVPNDWTTMAFWQYSWTGTVPGISGQVDLDVFNGTLAQLQAFANPDKPPTGDLDAADCKSIAGWASDADTPTTPVKIDLYVDATPGAATGAWQSVQASDPHGTQGNHGFSVSTPFGALDGTSHVVHAYAIDTSGKGPNPELTNSPKTINCTAPAIPSGVKRHVVDTTSMGNWKWGALDVLHVDPSKLAPIVKGPDWPATPGFVHGDAPGDAQVWMIDGSVKRKVNSDAVLAAWRIDKSKVTALAESKLQAMTRGPDWRASPFVAQGNGQPEVWVIDDDPSSSPPPFVPLAPTGENPNGAPANAGANQSGGCAVVSSRAGASGDAASFSLPSGAALVLLATLARRLRAARR